MSYPFTIFGTLIYLAYAGIVLLLVVLPMRLLGLHKTHWKWWISGLVVLPLLAGPVVEEYWIAYHFERLCRDAGVHVFRKVEADGYLDDTSYSSPAGLSDGLMYDDPKRLARFDGTGYQYKEYRLNDGRVWHVERRSDGVYGQIIAKPQARYHYKHAYQPTPHKYDEPVGWKLEKVESLVVDSEKKEIIAKEIHFKRRPSYIEGLWIQLVGSGLTICYQPLSDHENKTPTGLLPYHVFVPIVAR